jgi:photosystem II stability/assembly factor-like uncharacterized protein
MQNPGQMFMAAQKISKLYHNRPIFISNNGKGYLYLCVQVTFFVLLLSNGLYAQWKEIKIPGGSSAVSFEYNNWIIADISDSLFRSTDNGTSWHLFMNGFGEYEYSSQVSIHEGVLVSTEQFRGGNYYDLTDSIWKRADVPDQFKSIPKYNVLGPFFNGKYRYVTIKNNEDSVSTITNGLYVSTDTGQSYQKITELPPSEVLFELRAWQGKALYADAQWNDSLTGKHEQGKFISSDFGYSWKPFVFPSVEGAIDRQNIFLTDSVVIVLVRINDSTDNNYFKLFRSFDYSDTWKEIRKGYVDSFVRFNKVMSVADGVRLIRAPDRYAEYGFYDLMNTNDSMIFRQFSDRSLKLNAITAVNNGYLISTQLGVCRADTELTITDYLSLALMKGEPVYLFSQGSKIVSCDIADIGTGSTPYGKSYNTDFGIRGYWTSEDGGKLWKRVLLNEKTRLSGYPWKRSGENLYATGGYVGRDEGAFLRSSDNGDNWHVISSIPPYSVTQNFLIEDNHVLTVGLGKPMNGDWTPETSAFYSSDLGITWSPLCSGFTYFSPYFTFAIDNNSIFVTTSQADFPWRTRDYGNTWGTNSRFLDSGAYQYTLQKIGKYILTFANHWVDTVKYTVVYRTTDRGLSWEEVGEGLNEFKNSQFTYDFFMERNGVLTILLNSPNYLFYNSFDTGKTWVRSMLNPPNTTILYDSDLHNDGDNIFLNARGRLWKLEEPNLLSIAKDVEKTNLPTMNSRLYSGERNSITVSVTKSINQDMQIELFDILGRTTAVINNDQIFVEKGNIQFYVPKVPIGIYILVCRVGDSHETRKVIIE